MESNTINKENYTIYNFFLFVQGVFDKAFYNVFDEICGLASVHTSGQDQAHR